MPVGAAVCPAAGQAIKALYALTAQEPYLTHAAVEQARANHMAAQANVAFGKLKTFGDVLSQVQMSYVEEPNVDELINGAIKGMLQTLDAHSSYLTPDMLKQVEVETKGSFGGLGIEIGMKDNVLTVIAPIDDTPAFRAGILRFDDCKDLAVRASETARRKAFLGLVLFTQALVFDATANTFGATTSDAAANRARSAAVSMS